MNSIKDLQKKADEVIEKIDKKLGVKHNINSTFIHLIEEIGEVANELNKPNIRNEQIEKEHLGEELTDVMIFIARIANIYDIDLDDAINKKVEKLEKRHNLILK